MHLINHILTSKITSNNIIKLLQLLNCLDSPLVFCCGHALQHKICIDFKTKIPTCYKLLLTCSYVKCFNVTYTGRWKANNYMILQLFWANIRKISCLIRAPVAYSKLPRQLGVYKLRGRATADCYDKLPVRISWETVGKRFLLRLHLWLCISIPWKRNCFVMQPVHNSTISMIRGMTSNLDT